jgi:predicted nucleic acid-binding protein
MGLITGLLTLPLAPVRGVVWVADQLAAVAEQELYNPDAIYAELRELSADLEAGRISEEEFDRAEDLLLQRLQDALDRSSRS